MSRDNQPRSLRVLTKPTLHFLLCERNHYWILLIIATKLISSYRRGGPVVRATALQLKDLDSIPLSSHSKILWAKVSLFDPQHKWNNMEEKLACCAHEYHAWPATSIFIWWPGISLSRLQERRDLHIPPLHSWPSVLECGSSTLQNNNKN